MSARTPRFDEIQHTLKKTAAALNAAELDFCSRAAWRAGRAAASRRPAT